MDESKLIEVCDNCLCASCAYGEFMCDEAAYAGTKLMTIGELKKLGLENEHYWRDRKLIEMYGTHNLFGDLYK